MVLYGTLYYKQCGLYGVFLYIKENIKRTNKMTTIGKDTLKTAYDNENDYDRQRELTKAIQVLEKAENGETLVNNTIKWSVYGIGVIIITASMLFGFGYLSKQYNVWAMEMSGKAKLAEATQSRQIQIEQAKGEKEAAQYTAEAIGIVGKAAKAYPEYRQQMYIQAFGEALTGGKIQQIIYIPTENGMPILEAGRKVGGE
jgi:hypothetical protein